MLQEDRAIPPELINDITLLPQAAVLSFAGSAGALHTTTADLLAAPLPAIDVVLVGDLFYERTLADRVVVAIEAAAAKGTLVLIGDPQRNYFPRDRFERLADYDVPVTREIEDAENKKTAVWRLG